jgi:MscS family membrane protein
VFFAGQYLQLGDSLSPVYFNFVRSLIAFTIFWSLHRAIEPLSGLFLRVAKLLTPMMLQWIFKVLRVLVVFIGAAVILEIWGIAVGPLLAGLGLFGAAVALGAQDLFKNLIGGATIIAEKRFHPGEWILVDGVVEGIVEDVGFRSTKVRRFDKAPVHVPNSQLSDAVVTNFSRMTHRRIYWTIGVTYGTSAEQLKTLCDGMMDYITSRPEEFAQPEEVSTFVRIDKFGPSSIDIMLYCFTRTTDWGTWLEIKENFALAIKELVEQKAASAFAFPSQSLYIESLPPGADTPERFVPPQQKDKS